VVIVGLLILSCSGLSFFIYPGWTFQARIGVGIGAVLLIGTILLHPGITRLMLAGRSVQERSKSMAIPLFFGLLVLINLLSLTHNYEYDLTETGMFSLPEQTMKVLKDMQEPVHFLTPLQTGFTLFTTVIFIPLIVLVTGIVIWWKRR
jgi:hypothetical protein